MFLATIQKCDDRLTALLPCLPKLLQLIKFYAAANPATRSLNFVSFHRFCSQPQLLRYTVHDPMFGGRARLTLPNGNFTALALRRLEGHLQYRYATHRVPLGSGENSRAYRSRT